MISVVFSKFRSHRVKIEKVVTETFSQQNALVLVTEPTLNKHVLKSLIVEQNVEKGSINPPGGLQKKINSF